MKRIFLVIVAFLLSTSPALAQQWDRVNGSMQVKSGPSAPLVIIDQTRAGQKILSLRSNGTEKCFINVSGDFTCIGTMTLGPSGVLTVSASAVTSTVPILLPDGTFAAPVLAQASNLDVGFGFATDTIYATVNSSGAWITRAMEFTVPSGMVIAWSSTSNPLNAADLSLSREAAAVLQIGVDAAGVTDQMFKGPDRITSDGVGGNLTIAGGRNRGASAGGSIIFQTAPAAGAGVTGTLANAAIIDSTGAFTLVGRIVTVGTVGVAAVAAYGNVVAATNVGTASIATVTPAVDTTYEVSANCLVTTSTTHSFSLDVTYTDESNVARTMILPVAALAGAFVTGGLITNVTGAGPYESAVMTIRAKASTAVTVRTSAGGTFTTVVYNARGVIKQVS